MGWVVEGGLRAETQTPAGFLVSELQKKAVSKTVSGSAGTVN